MKIPADDIDHMMSVMEAAFDPQFGESWSRRQIEDSMIGGNCHYVLVDKTGSIIGDEGAAVGFSLSRFGVDEEELLLFAVMPLFQKLGIGRKLLNAFIQSASARGAKRLLLEMREGNPAERLYRSAGFQPIGQRPQYYKAASGDWLGAITFAKDV